MSKNRLIYIDNLRLLMIIFVIMIHLASTYSGIGDWYYIETKQLGVVELAFFGYFESFTQGYFMGILFLIAGYFVPGSYDKKGFGKFIKERIIRLGIPTLLHMLIIVPIIELVIIRRPEFIKNGSWNFFVKYIIKGHFLKNSGPLWFAVALLFFSIIYAIIRKIFKLEPKNTDKEFPKFPYIFAIILLISICAFLIRIVQPIGTQIYSFQFCFFAQYIILFIVGLKCKRNNWFEKLKFSQGRIWFIWGTFGGLVSWSFMMILGGALNGKQSLFMGGFTWQSAAYVLWESSIAVSMSIGLISLFKEKLNKQNKLIGKMSDNSFAVYVLHAPIIIALSMLFAPIKINLIVKFIILVTISITTCFMCIDYIIMKIPFFKKLLSQ